MKIFYEFDCRNAAVTCKSQVYRRNKIRSTAQVPTANNFKRQFYCEIAMMIYYINASTSNTFKKRFYVTSWLFSVKSSFVMRVQIAHRQTLQLFNSLRKESFFFFLKIDSFTRSEINRLTVIIYFRFVSLREHYLKRLKGKNESAVIKS